MASTTPPPDDSRDPTEMDRASVHHYIRRHGRAPTPAERQSGAVSIPRPRSPERLRLPPVRRALARLIHRL